MKKTENHDVILSNTSTAYIALDSSEVCIYSHYFPTSGYIHLYENQVPFNFAVLKLSSMYYGPIVVIVGKDVEIGETTPFRLS